AGNLIHTSDVSILRGPLEEGAPWLRDAARIDVYLVALQRSPRFDEEGRHYASREERADAAAALGRLVAAAAEQGVHTLVLPPPGAGGASGCRHPAEIARLLREAVLRYGAGIKKVILCREYPGQLHGGRWEDFAHAWGEGLRHPGRTTDALASSLRLKPGYEAAANTFSPGWLRRLGSCSLLLLLLLLLLLKLLLKLLL
ncbi:unnamed protein product, partial [Polarella glacialis]